jgi:hypothetical protein
MLSRPEIEKILCAELEVAKKRNALAADTFRAVMNEVPSGIPTADGTFRIEIVGAERRTALQELQIALKRYNGLIVLGIVPEEFKIR